MFRTRARASALAVGALFVYSSACDESQPVGPDGLPELPESVGAWLSANAFPLDPLDPDGPVDDLEPLRGLLSDARIVALGEATHGTREFALMKHRLLRFLVEELGFGAIALEAPWAEAYRIDDYVRTGTGDPETLLSGLYLWPWNTREVLDVVGWLREHNQDSPDPVRFLGIDMQFPGMAIQNVKAFVSQVDPTRLPEVEGGLECLERFANDPAGRFPAPEYADQLRQAYREPCRRSLDDVYALLASHEVEYTQASNPDAFAWALQSARLAVQFEDHASALVLYMRDLYMAENVAWHLDRLGPGGRLVVWSHNYHVANMPIFMGQELKHRYGDEVVLVGFNFFRGGFNAGPPGVATVLGQPEPHSVSGPIPYAYGHYFSEAGLPRFALALRGVDVSAPSWLRGPRPLRAIGSEFDPTDPDDFFWVSRLPEEFDVVVYIHDSTPSTLLLFQYPGGF